MPYIKHQEPKTIKHQQTATLTRRVDIRTISKEHAQPPKAACATHLPAVPKARTANGDSNLGPSNGRSSSKAATVLEERRPTQRELRRILMNVLQTAPEVSLSLTRTPSDECTANSP